MTRTIRLRLNEELTIKVKSHYENQMKKNNIMIELSPSQAVEAAMMNSLGIEPEINIKKGRIWIR